LDLTRTSFTRAVSSNAGSGSTRSHVRSVCVPAAIRTRTAFDAMLPGQVPTVRPPRLRSTTACTVYSPGWMASIRLRPPITVVASSTIHLPGPTSAKCATSTGSGSTQDGPRRGSFIVLETYTATDPVNGPE